MGEKSQTKGVTRRGFLKGTGLALASTGLALNLSANDAHAAARKVPKKWDRTIDVAVIGSGFAGLAAAAEAGKAGAKVLIIEKMPFYGGNSIISGGSYCSWDDKYHLRDKLKLGTDSPEKHKEDTLKGGDFYNNPELVDVMVKGAPDGLNWMIDEGGLKIRQLLSRGGGHTAFRTHISDDATGRPYCEALRRIAEKHGATIALRTKVTWIWRESTDGPILGIEVESNKRKSNIRVKRGLVIASGGFGRDTKMRQDFNPGIVPEFNCTNQPGATGEMIRYAQAVGADALHLAFIQLFPFAEPEKGLLDKYGVYAARIGFGLIYVNKLGKRFVNESERRDVCSYAQINMGMKPTYTILNRKMMAKLGAEKDLDAGVAAGRFIQAETITELAKKSGIDEKGLTDTVARNNGFIRAGKDPDFNKTITKDMIPLEEGPFFALPQWPAVHHCMGGLRINKSAQIIDIWGKPIPRLYAAGEVAGGVQGSNRLAANAYPTCVVFGRIAGTNAAKEKSSV